MKRNDIAARQADGLERLRAIARGPTKGPEGSAARDAREMLLHMKETWELPQAPREAPIALSSNGASVPVLHLPSRRAKRAPRAKSSAPAEDERERLPFDAERDARHMVDVSLPPVRVRLMSPREWLVLVAGLMILLGLWMR